MWPTPTAARASSAVPGGPEPIERGVLRDRTCRRTTTLVVGAGPVALGGGAAPSAPRSMPVRAPTPSSRRNWPPRPLPAPTSITAARRRRSALQLSQRLERTGARTWCGRAACSASREHAVGKGPDRRRSRRRSRKPSGDGRAAARAPATSRQCGENCTAPAARDRGGPLDAGERTRHAWPLSTAAFRIAGAVISLTYDDGPDPVWTPRVLDVLAEHGASATFFVLGPAAERHPEPAAARPRRGPRGRAARRRARAPHRARRRASWRTTPAARWSGWPALDVRPRRWRAPWGVTTAGHARDRRPDGTWSWCTGRVDTHDWRGDAAGRHAGGLRARRRRRQRGADARRARAGCAPRGLRPDRGADRAPAGRARDLPALSLERMAA